MLSLITLPGTAVASTTEFIGTLTTDLWGIIAIAIGIPLAFYVIDIILGLGNDNDRSLSELRTGVEKLKTGIAEQEKFYS